jgi:uroporphyrinogen decarboxylase
MDFPLHESSDIARLTTDAIEERLNYATEALRLLKGQLGNRTALLGFAGSPWTLANFMLDGGSSNNHERALHLLRHDRSLLNSLLQKLTVAVTQFLRAQIAAGVDAVQIFDSHGGLLPNDLFEAGSGEWIRRIIAEIDDSIPVIVFAKGARDWNTLLSLGANVIGLDSDVNLAEMRKLFPDDIALQGNLAPELLIDFTPNELEVKTNALLEKMRGRPGYIFNLGHGVPPAAPLENIGQVVKTVRSFKNGNQNHFS